VRLHAILQSIPNIRSAQRNNVDITEDQLPAAALFDGDEETDDSSDTSMRPPNRPTMVSMTPAIVLVQQSNEAGSDLSTLRRELLKRVLTDTALNDTIVKTGRNGNGVIRYLGCSTDFGEGRSLTGGLMVRMMFRYVLKPDEL